MFEDIKEVQRTWSAVSSRSLIGGWSVGVGYELEHARSNRSLNNGKPLRMAYGQICILQRPLRLLCSEEIRVGAVGRLLLKHPGKRLVAQTSTVVIRVERVGSFLLAVLVMMAIH